MDLGHQVILDVCVFPIWNTILITEIIQIGGVIMVDLILAVSIFLHLIATVFWIGGIVIFNFLIVPTVQKHLDPPTAGKFMGPLGRTARKIAYTGIILFIASGSLMTVVNRNYEGLLVMENVWSQVMVVKHFLVALLIILGIYHYEVLIPRQARFAGPPSEELEKTERRLKFSGITAVILVFLILLLTAVASTITTVQ